MMIENAYKISEKLTGKTALKTKVWMEGKQPVTIHVTDITCGVDSTE
jgi:hypothetical protein